jgi:hypothetical protein
MHLRIDHSRYHRSAIRRLRNPNVIVWTSIVVIGLFTLLIVSFVVLHLYHWLYSLPPSPLTRFVVMLSTMLFGLASTLGFILAIWIIGDINPERFTTAQELLRHCIDLFDDANKNNCNVKLLILFPNPGQFDEVFYLTKEHHFSDLKEKLKDCVNNPKVNIEIVCLQGNTTDSNSSLRNFLKMFYESEAWRVSPKELENRGQLEGYCGPVKKFIEDYLANKDRLTLGPIHDGWLSKMKTGEPMITIGYAKREAFLGAIAFKNATKFNFVGFDFEGNVGTIEPLYEAMKTKYMAAPIPERPQQNTTPK